MNTFLLMDEGYDEMLFHVPGRLDAKQVGWFPSSAVKNDLLEYDAWVQRLYPQRVLSCIRRQVDGALHHAFCHGGIIDTLYIGRRLIEVGIEVDGLGCAIVKCHLITESSLVEEIKGRFHHDM